MKQAIKKILKKVYPALDTPQQDIIAPISAPNSKKSLLDNFFSVLNEIGFHPKHLVDVGANHGTWTREAIKHFPDAYFTLLEPQFQLEQSIADLVEIYPKVKFHAVGAGSKEGTFKFTLVERDDSCSFLFTEEEARLKGHTQIEVPVVTLNHFLDATNLPIPDLIKIDAEGLDLEVLLGADDYFGKTEIFLVEAGVGAKAIENSALKIMNFMDDKGYRLFDVTDMNRPGSYRALWLVELAFIKKEGFVDRQFENKKIENDKCN